MSFRFMIDEVFVLKNIRKLLRFSTRSPFFLVDFRFSVRFFVCKIMMEEVQSVLTNHLMNQITSTLWAHTNNA